MTGSVGWGWGGELPPDADASSSFLPSSGQTAPGGPPSTHTGKAGWVGDVEGSELQGGGDDDDDDGKEKDNNSHSLNMQESMSSLTPRAGGPGVRLEQPWKAGRTVRLGPASHCANRFISVGEGGGQAGA